ncbi:MAG: hypothetical protein QOG35_2799 [Solirubrobacteraceae bacterium]|jgi:threonine/homoserine/homoserine lactone efflux protein|nr:hypothetical protein [Solirubrobacteraceae bacterium]
MSAFPSFLAVAAAALLVPGPDTLVVLRTALGSGAVAGTWAAAGSGAGNLAWGSASVLGATGVLAASHAAFTALELAGATYLALLGVQALRAAARGEPLHATTGPSGALAPVAAFRRGLASDALNVKVGLFWTALVPQFLTPGAGPLLPVAMVLAMGGLAFAWLAGCARLAARLSCALGRPGFARALNALTGLAFVAVGIRLVLAAG